MKKGSQSIKTVLISESKDCILKDNLWVNKWSTFKKLVELHYPTLYRKHILKNFLRKDHTIRRLVNWPLLVAEMDEKGYFNNEILKS